MERSRIPSLLHEKLDPWSLSRLYEVFSAHDRAIYTTAQPGSSSDARIGALDAHEVICQLDRPTTFQLTRFPTSRSNGQEQEETSIDRFVRNIWEGCHNTVNLPHTNQGLSLRSKMRPSGWREMLDTVIAEEQQMQELALTPKGWSALQKSRNALIVDLFQALDVNKSGRLTFPEMLGFARLVGFQGSVEDFQNQYVKLCQGCDQGEVFGLDMDGFTRLVNDTGSAYGCDDDKLKALLHRLGVASLTSALWHSVSVELQHSREDCIQDVFQTLDLNQSGRLTCAEMFRFARLVGVHGMGDFEKAYVDLCQSCGRDPQSGFHVDAFKKLVSDGETGYSCDDEKLRKLRSRLGVIASSEASGSPTSTMQQRSRPDRIKELFQVLDVNKSGRVTRPEMFRFAQLFGFRGSMDAFQQDYVDLCQLHGQDERSGFDFKGFTELVNDNESIYKCDTDELIELLSRLRAASSAVASTSAAPGRQQQSCECITDLFQALDLNKSGRLTCPEMFNFVQLLGFNGSMRSFQEEYARLCQFHSQDQQSGFALEVFAELLGDKEGGYHCDDDKVKDLLRQLSGASSASRDAAVLRGSREEFIRNLFQALDVNKSGWLTCPEMFHFAQLHRFLDSMDVLQKRNADLCQSHSLDEHIGLDVQAFTEVVTNSQSSYRCDEDKLTDLLAQLNGKTSGAAVARQAQAVQPQSRKDLIQDIFRVLDVKRSGCLTCPEMFSFARLVGFQGSAEDFQEEFAELCKGRNLDNSGCDINFLTKLLNDPSSAYECDDKKLMDLLSQLDVERTGAAVAAAAPARALQQEHRKNLVQNLFGALDVTESEHLTCCEMSRFLGLAGFLGSEEDFRTGYAQLCASHGQDGKTGLDLEAFMRTVTDNQSAYRCDDDKLVHLLSQLGIAGSSKSAAFAAHAAQQWSREDLIGDLFQALDMNKSGQLTHPEMFRFMQLVGSLGRLDEFHEEYAHLCQVHSPDKQQGLNLEAFVELVTDTESAYRCDNDRLADLLSQVLVAGAPGSPASAASELQQSRQDLIQHLFEALDMNKSGRLTRPEMFRFVQLVDVHGTMNDFDELYLNWCKLLGQEEKIGFSLEAFTAIVNDTQNTCFCDDDMLTHLHSLLGGVSSPALQSSAAQSASAGLRAQPKHRVNLIRDVFEALDEQKNGRLNELQMYHFATLVGLQGNCDQFPKKYNELCHSFGQDADLGFSAQAFTELVNDTDMEYFCDYHMLMDLRSWLNLPGSRTSIDPAVHPASAAVTEASARMDRIAELFQALDVNNKQRLEDTEMFHFAQLLGFPGSMHDFEEKHIDLCQSCGQDKSGFDEKAFRILVNDVESPYLCDDELLADCLKKLSLRTTSGHPDDQCMLSRPSRRLHSDPGDYSQRRELAARLDEALGHKSLEELEALPLEERKELLCKVEVQHLLMSTSAVMELEVLLGVKSARLLRLAEQFRRAATLGHLGELRSLLQEDGAREALLQRDSNGNVVLHDCSDIDTMTLLVQQEPSTWKAKNKAGQSPLHTYLERHPEADLQALQTVASNLADFFELDDKAVSPAMLLNPVAQLELQHLVSPWTEFEAALKADVGEVLPALMKLHPFEAWSGVLHYHCFGERRVWKHGLHTWISRSRVLTVWSSIDIAFDAVEDRQESGRDVARALLVATKGPRHEKLDPRQPYRMKLEQRVCKFETQSSKLLGSIYESMGKEESELWLLSVPSELSTKDLSSNWTDLDEAVSALGVQPRLHMGVTPPHWLMNPDMQVIFQELQKLGMAGATEKSDAVYELYCLADTGDELQQQGVTDEDMVLARWYAAWLRAVCQQHQEVSCEAIRRALCLSVEGANPSFLYRTEAKRYTRICEKLLEEVCDLAKEIEAWRYESKTDAEGFTKDCGPQGACASSGLSSHIKRLIRQAANFICDISACTYVAESAAELREAHRRLQNSTLRIARTKNGFDRAADAPTGYRDLKVWIECDSPSGPLMVELQYQLRQFYNEKKWMHLPYEIRRGSFDWPHIFSRLLKLEVSSAEGVAGVVQSDSAPQTVANPNSIRVEVADLLARVPRTADLYGRLPSVATWLMPMPHTWPVKEDRTPCLPSSSADTEEHDAVRALLISWYHRDGITPLHLAARGGRVDFAKQLIEAHASVNAVSAQTEDGEGAGMAKVTLDVMAEDQSKEIFGRTPLHDAVSSGALSMVQLLLSARAMHNVADANGNTPLQLAICAGHRDIADQLAKAAVATADQRGDPFLSTQLGLSMACAMHHVPYHLWPSVATWLEQLPCLINRSPVQEPTLTVVESDGACGVVKIDDQLQLPTQLAGASEEALGAETIDNLQEHLAEAPPTQNVPGVHSQRPVQRSYRRTKSLFAEFYSRPSVGSWLLQRQGSSEWHDVAVALVAIQPEQSHGPRAASFKKRPSVGTWLARPMAGPAQLQILASMTAVTGNRNDATASQGPQPVIGHLALHFAANRGDLVAVKMLILAHADPRSTDDNGVTPLHLASEAGHEAVVNELLAAGALPDAATEGHSMKSRGVTPLHAAACFGHAAIADRLLEARALPGATRGDGVVPLHFAAQNGNVTIMKVLIGAGSPIMPVSVNGFTPLHDAAHEGHAAGAFLLLVSRASPNFTTEDGASPLHSAARRGHTEVVTWLLAFGASPAAQSEGGFTALHDAAHGGHLRMCQQLLCASAPLDALAAEDTTALQLAAYAGHTEVVAMMVANAAGSEPANSLSARSVSASLRLAVRRGHVGVVRTLRNYRRALAVSRSMVGGGSSGRNSARGSPPVHLQ